MQCGDRLSFVKGVLNIVLQDRSQGFDQIHGVSYNLVSQLSRISQVSELRKSRIPKYLSHLSENSDVCRQFMWDLFSLVNFLLFTLF